jgi:hypothetical protein
VNQPHCPFTFSKLWTPSSPLPSAVSACATSTQFVKPSSQIHFLSFHNSLLPAHPTTHTETFPPPHDPQPVSQCNCSMPHSCLRQTKYLYHLIAHNLKDTRMQRTLAWVRRIMNWPGKQRGGRSESKLLLHRSLHSIQSNPANKKSKYDSFSRPKTQHYSTPPPFSDYHTWYGLGFRFTPWQFLARCGDCWESAAQGSWNSPALLFTKIMSKVLGEKKGAAKYMLLIMLLMPIQQ